MIQRTAQMLLCTLCCLAGAPTAQAEVQTTPQQQVSDAFIRSAVSLMEYTQAVEGEAPTILATTMLDAALGLTPDNTEAWAMRVELARATPDAEDDESALVRYLATGVRDDRASYDLIRLRLAKSNTLDAQLRSLTELLESDAGKTIASSLRSRLAMLASSMGRELLDEPARRKWAIEAARSDPANADAAQAMLDLVTELGGDDVRRGTAMVNLVRALPLKPGPRLQLAALLADHGAYETAASQYQIVATRLSQGPLQLADYITWAQCLAIGGQDEVARQLINEFEQALNQPSADQQNQGEDAEPFEPAPLPMSLALVRLALLDQDAEAAQPVFDGIADRLREASQSAEEQAAKTDAADQLALLAAVFAPDLEQAARIVAEHDQAEDSTPWVHTIAEGWLALRRGETDQAKDLLGQVNEKHALASCGLALAVGEDAAGKARLLQDVIRDLPAASPASLAAGRALKKLDQTPRPTTTGRALLNLMSKYPRAFWAVDLERSPWLAVRLSIDPPRVKPLEPFEAEVTVWNSTNFPLSIGENSPIQPNAIVLLKATTSGQALPTPGPIVIDLQRRFSLAAGERMIFKTRLDYHQFGILRQNNPGRTFVFDAKLIVNPQINRSGIWKPAGIGKSAEVRNGLVQDRGTTAQAIDTWIEQLDSTIPIDRLEALRRLAALSPGSQPDLVTPELLARVRPKLIEQWNKGDAKTRAWILVNARPIEQEGAAYPQLAELATQSDEELVWLALLSTHANTPGSELLSAAVARQDLPEVARFGERLRRLLREIEALREASEQNQENDQDELDGLGGQQGDLIEP